MNQPILLSNEKWWRDLLRNLPQDQHAFVREAVTAAVREYFDHANRDARRAADWKTLHRRAKGVRGLGRIISKLSVDDPWAAGSPEQLAELSGLAARAADAIAFYKPRRRLERFYTSLINIWLHAGGKLSAHNEGQLAVFLRTIANQARLRLGRDAAKQRIGNYARIKRDVRTALHRFDASFAGQTFAGTAFAVEDPALKSGLGR